MLLKNDLLLPISNPRLRCFTIMKILAYNISMRITTIKDKSLLGIMPLF